MSHHGYEGEPDLPTFAFERTGGTVLVASCSDGESWHWQFMPNTPPATMPAMTGYMEWTEAGPVPVTEEVPFEPPIYHMTTEQILTALSPDEARLFIGWLGHVHEQLGAHLEALADAVQLAVAERRWDGIKTIAEELHMACCMRANVEEAARHALELT